MWSLPMSELHLVPCGAPADEECSDEARTIAINRLPCIIGRASGCDHRINDPMISRRHCALSLRDGQAWIEDLSSLNGTRINGEPVLAPRPVADGNVLQLAHLSFVVRQQDIPAESRPKPDRLTGVRTGELDRFNR
jgi:pSer/pThr/pTyr-binding forkhead associated (FHA) protein